MKQNAVIGLVLGTTAVAGFVVITLFDPMQYGFYPKCMLHSMTGWSCPGCGTLRALHALGHGHVVEALRLNPMIVVGFPIVGIVMVIRWWRERGRPPAHPQQPVVSSWLLWSGLAVLVLFGILRNVPVPMLHWLAP
jgi:hypothetical protein